MATNKIQKFINDQKEFIIEISSIGTSKGFKQTLSDFRDDIDKFINTLDFDERYLLKKKFDDEMESIFNSVDSKKIPHSDYVCQMFCEVVDDGIKSGINRIRIKSELKKSTTEIHSIEDLFFANNSVEKRNGWFKNIDVDQKKTIIDLIRSECGKFRSSLESHLSKLNEQFNRKEVV